jgi:hypothetical protein
MAEEKVPDVEFYFYQDLDKAFLEIANTVRANPASRNNVFANVMSVTRDNKKDVVVFVSKSDDEDDQGQRKYNVNKEARMRQVRNAGLKRVYTMPQNLMDDAIFSTIDFGQVLNGTIDVRPLNDYIAGRKHLTNFKSLTEYKDCTTIECIRSKEKCGSGFYVDDEYKFSDKPNTYIFCRRYGLLELTDELNSIQDYDKFIAELKKAYSTNFELANRAEDYLRDAGSDNAKKHLARYRLPAVSLNEAERTLALELAQDAVENTLLFAEKIRRRVFSGVEDERNSIEKIRTYLKHHGSSEVKKQLNLLDAQINNIYIEERERKLRQLRQTGVAPEKKEEFTFAQMTFSIGQRVVEQVQRGIRNVRNIDYSGLATRVGTGIAEQTERMSALFRRRRAQQPILPAPRANLLREDINEARRGRGGEEEPNERYV